MSLSRAALRDGMARFGAITTVGDSLVTEVLGHSGVDWVCVDLQHGAFGDDALFPVLQALELTGTSALVRVRWNEPASIMRALDAGAAGVIVPMVETVEQAAAAVAACRYPPAGIRSWGPIRARYSMPGYSPQRADDTVICAVMVETIAGLAAVRSLAGVAGLDAIFVGPSDLSLSMGYPPSLGMPPPEVDEAIWQITDACANAEITAGIFTAGSDQALRWAGRGFRLVSVHSDRLLMAERAEQIMGEIRSAAAGPAAATT